MSVFLCNSTENCSWGFSWESASVVWIVALCVTWPWLFQRVETAATPVNFGVRSCRWQFFINMVNDRKHCTSEVIHHMFSNSKSGTSTINGVKYVHSQCIKCRGSLTRYVILLVAHAPGMPGTFSPPPRVRDLGMHHGTCVTHVPWCMLGSLTSGFLWRQWWGKRSRQCRRMHNPQFTHLVTSPCQGSSGNLTFWILFQ